MQAARRVRLAGGISGIVHIRICHEGLTVAILAVARDSVALVHHDAIVAHATPFDVCVFPATSVGGKRGVGPETCDAIVITTH